jgi:hypothetical protein
MGIMSLKELQRSDFERSFHSDYGRAVARSLKKQYRMAPKINDVVATAFYRGQELKPERGPQAIARRALFRRQGVGDDRVFPFRAERAASTALGWGKLH